MLDLAAVSNRERRVLLHERGPRRGITSAWVLAAMLVSVVVSGCTGDEPPPSPPPPEVLVLPAAQRTVEIHQEWIGSLNGYINASIRPQVRGYILTRNYNEGQVVHAGQLLFQIDPREFQAELDQARGQLAQAQAALGKTQLDVARYQPLAAEGAVSQQELDNAVQANRANEAAVAAAQAAVEQAKLNLEWTRVTSPIDGVAGIAVAQIGDLVDPSTELTTVSQVDPIKAVFPVSEQQYLRYARGVAERGDSGAREGALELVLADGVVYAHRGTVSAIGREIDPRTGTLIIEALFPNPGNVLRPGGYAKVRAVVEERADAVVVPQRAVQDVQGQAQVAVIGANDVAEWRNVVAGPRSGDDWVIESGLQAGERVVVEGVQKVRSGMRVLPQPYAPATVTPTPAPLTPLVPPPTPPAGATPPA